MGARDDPGGRQEAKAGAPQPAAPSPEVVSAAPDDGVSSARQDAPQDWALLDRVLDGSPIGIIVVDRDLRILRVNTRAAEMFGADERRHAGHALREVLPEMYAEISAILSDIVEGGAPHLAVETSAPKIGARAPRRLYLAYYYPLLADQAVIGVGCMFIDVTDQRAAEGALLESESKRRTILGEMLRAEESERSRLALELHDDTIQVLCALLLQLDGTIPLARRGGDEEVTQRLTRSRHVLSTATERARRLMFELHPNVLPERGLRVAITALAEEIARDTGAGWSVDVTPDRYPWTVEEFAYRVVREALTNVRKHSGARAFSVMLCERDSLLVGVVQDDGRGFGAERVERDSANHLGIDGMRERARLAGGDVTITSAPGEGVRVEFSFPFRDPS